MHLTTSSERLRAVLAPSWGRLGGDLVRPGAKLARLGSVLASVKPHRPPQKNLEIPVVFEGFSKFRYFRI